MLRLICYTAILLVGYLTVCSNRVRASEYPDNAIYKVDDSGSIQNLLEIARHRLNVTARKKSDFDTAYYYTRKALRLSESMHSPSWRSECLGVLGSYYYEQGDKKTGREDFLDAWTSAKKSGSLESQLKCLRSMSNYVSKDTSLYPMLLSVRDRILEAFKRQKEQKTIFDSVNAIVADLAELGMKGFKTQDMRTLLDADVCARGLGEKSPRIVLEPYFNLCWYYFYQGDMTKAFYYALQGLKITESGSGQSKIEDIEAGYSNMGFIYFALGNTEKSIIYYRKALECLRSNGLPFGGRLLKAMTKALLKDNRAGEALQLLQEKTVALSPYEEEEKQIIINDCMGMCYQALKDYGKAETFYLQSLEKGKAQGKEKMVAANFLLSNLYIECQQYEKAKGCLNFLVADSNSSMVPLSALTNAHLLLFKADSAQKDYPAAFRELSLYRTLNDSIFDATKNKQIEELKVQYETDKNEKDIQLLTKQNVLQASRIRQQKLASAFKGEVRKRELDEETYETNRKDAELKLAAYGATEKDKNLQLKEQNIQLLIKQKQLRQADLRHTRFFRDVFIAGVILLVIMLVLLLNRYLLKQRSNRLLEAQREMIHLSNLELRQLNSNQEKLLLQKEWLIKEIHHRVKNNLQIIISLLNAQLDFLENNPQALYAIQTSQERMHAIALIHQKLYQRDENSTIDMCSYIRELITHLGAGFSAAGRIHFSLDVEPIDLDISQAVPLGLILNEAITNAVKYAFPRDRTGTIQITLRTKSEQEILVLISDDGQGFSEKALATGNNSLGTELIELFAEQLGASLNRTTDKGVSIRLVFKQMTSKIQKLAAKLVHA